MIIPGQFGFNCPNMNIMRYGVNVNETTTPKSNTTNDLSVIFFKELWCFSKIHNHILFKKTSCGQIENEIMIMNFGEASKFFKKK